jgi:protein SCO1
VTTAPAEAPLARRSRRLAWIAPLLLTAAGLCVLLAFRRGPSLPVYWSLPAFRLQDQNAQPYGLDELRGRPWVAAFIFTKCGGTCPVMTTRMARLQPRLPAGAQLVSITVDPGHDTPDVLRAYARQVNAGPQWHFLTGATADLYRLATLGFKLEAAEAASGEMGPDEGPFLHSSKLVLVDASARVRGYYDSGDDVAMDALATDLVRLGETP